MDVDNGCSGTVKVSTDNLCFAFSWTITIVCFCFLPHLQHCYVNFKLNILKKTHNQWGCSEKHPRLLLIFLVKNRIVEISLVRELSVLQKHLCAPSSRCDRKDLERVPVRAKVWLDPK